MTIILDDLAITAEDLGRAVRRIWIDTARALIPDPKPSWVTEWDNLDDFQRAADIAIGTGIAQLVLLALPQMPAAVQLTDDADPAVLTVWSGGQLRRRECEIPGEYETELVLPGGAIAVEGDWLIKTPAGIVIAAEVLTASPQLPGTPETVLRKMNTYPGLPTGLLPAAPTAAVSADIRDARIGLLDEETAGLRDAMCTEILEDIARHVAGVIIAASGTGILYGLPVDALVAEVHDSNTTKAIRPGGLEPAQGLSYRPPRIAAVLAEAARKLDGRL